MTIETTTIKAIPVPTKRFPACAKVAVLIAILIIAVAASQRAHAAGAASLFPIPPSMPLSPRIPAAKPRSSPVVAFGESRPFSSTSKASRMPPPATPEAPSPRLTTKR